jgi:hypothetical protein
MRSPALLYTRALPGGGFVVIEATELPGVPGGADASYRASLCVERRTDPARRSGHTPPVVAEARGQSTEALLETLYPIASDNVAVAQRILLWQAANRPAVSGQ